VGASVAGEAEGLAVGMLLGENVKPATVGASVEGEAEGFAVGVLLGA